MPINAGNVVVRQGDTLEDFQTPFSTYIGAKFEEAVDYNPLNVMLDRSEFEIANRPELPRLTPDEIKQQAEQAGVQIDVPEDGLSQNAVAFLVNRRKRQMQQQDAINRSPTGVRSLAGFGTMLGASLLDPLNIGLAFVPVVGQAKYTSMIAQAGTPLGRAGVRAGVGAAEGAAGIAALEPFTFAMHQTLQDDYSMMDSLINIGFGSVMGGGLHVAGGALRDKFMGDWWKPEIPPAPLPDLPSTIRGINTEIKIGEGYEPARWSLVDAASVEATMLKADNQFRDRTRVASDEQIRDIANKIDFNMLAESPVMDFGAPVLTPDGRIIAGNGRMAAISRAYDIGTGMRYADPLRHKLEALGINPAAMDGMIKPALVRLLERDVDVRQAAMLSNEGGALRMSALEQAKVDAERLGSFRAFEVTANGDLNTMSNRMFVRQWVNEQPVNQRSALMDADGMLSAEGEKRLQNAVLFKAYGDSPTLGRLVEATDPGSRNVASALMRSASRVADAEEAIRNGDLFDLSITDDLRLAVEKLDQLRRENTSVADFLAQGDMLGTGMTPEAVQLMQFMSDNIRAPNRIAEMLNRYYEMLNEAGNPKQGDIFGAGAPRKQDMLLRAALEAEQAGANTAEAIVAKVSPQTREMAMRTAVGQAMDGRVVDVEPIIMADPAIQVRQIDTPQFKTWFGESKVVDDAGNPLVVYHGTQAEFDVFDYSKIGQQGRLEGAGFYFTNNEQVARGYGEPLKVYLSIKNPLEFDAKPFRKAILTKLIRKIADLESKDTGMEIGDGFLSNFGDVRYSGLDVVIKDAVDLVADDATALDQISGIVGAGVDVKIVNTAVRDVTGHDGVVSRGFGNEGDASNTIYVAFFPEQIKSADKNSGLFDPNSGSLTDMIKTSVQRQTSPESVRLADAQASAAADAKLKQARPSETLRDAEAELAMVMDDLTARMDVLSNPTLATAELKPFDDLIQSADELSLAARAAAICDLRG